MFLGHINDSIVLQPLVGIGCLLIVTFYFVVDSPTSSGYIEIYGEKRDVK